MALYNTYADKDLVVLLQQGDERAFREIYDRYWKKLLYKISKKTGDVPAAEEVVQEIFLSIWNRHHKLNITGELGAYLATAATYSVIKYRQKQQRQRAVYQEAAKLYNASENTTDNILDFERLQHRIARLVADLPEQTQLIYKLHKEEGHSYKDIAAALEISPKTVDYHVSRAVKQLRSSLSTFISFLTAYFF